MNNLYFNNKDLYRDFNAFILSNLELPVARKRIEVIETEGNSYGSLTEDNDIWEDIIINIPIRILTLDPSNMNLILNWVNNIEDDRLYFKENLDKCLKVKKINVSNIIKMNGIVRELTLECLCEPFWFGTLEEEINLINNENFFYEGDIEAAAVYEVQSKGKTRIFINDTLLEFDYNGTVFVDGKRKLCYSSDKRVVKSKGDFQKLKLGINNFTSDTGNDIKLKIENRHFI